MVPFLSFFESTKICHLRRKITAISRLWVRIPRNNWAAKLTKSRAFAAFLSFFGGWRCTQPSCSRLFVYLLLFASGPQAVFSYRLISRARACCDNTTALNKGGRRCILNVEPIKDGGLRNTYVRCVSQTFVFDTERSDFSSFHSLNMHWFWVEIWSCNKCKYY